MVIQFKIFVFCSHKWYSKTFNHKNVVSHGSEFKVTDIREVMFSGFVGHIIIAVQNKRKF